MFETFQRSVVRTSGAGPNRWRDPAVPILPAGEDQGLLGTDRPAVRTVGKELPTTHCSLSFLTSMRIVYCRINKLSTDNSSDTLRPAKISA
jgi:hypothetical protein